MGAQRALRTPQQPEERRIHVRIHIADEGVRERKRDAWIVLANVGGVPRESGLHYGCGDGPRLEQPYAGSGGRELHIGSTALSLQLTAHVQQPHRYRRSPRQRLHRGQSIRVGGLAAHHCVRPCGGIRHLQGARARLREHHPGNTAVHHALDHYRSTKRHVHVAGCRVCQHPVSREAAHARRYGIGQAMRRHVQGRLVQACKGVLGGVLGKCRGTHRAERPGGGRRQEPLQRGSIHAQFRCPTRLRQGIGATHDDLRQGQHDELRHVCGVGGA